VKPFSVVVCGGGVAGLEALLRLRRLAGERLDLTLISPSAQIAYRPMAVLEPFGLGHVQYFPITPIVADTATTWLRDQLSWVDLKHRAVHTADGRVVDYDALLIAVGGRRVSTATGALVFTDRAVDSYRRVADRLASGESEAIVFTVPHGPTWPLPLYELALLTRRRATEAGRTPDISVCEPDARPLAAFGKEASDAVARLLADSRVALHNRCTAEPSGAHWARLDVSDVRIPADHVVTLPKISGPNIRGLPGDAVDRFVMVDEYCRVKETDGRVFGAGDATQMPVKHGSLSAQQADCAAAGIAHLAGIGDAPGPLRPVIRGALLTGAAPLYLTASLIGREGWRSEVSDQPPWPVHAPQQKIVADELGRYLVLQPH
jgi:sulfide:quinone oxidoreductase